MSTRKVFGIVNSGVVIEENIECQGKAFNDMINLNSAFPPLRGGYIWIRLGY